MFKKTKKNDRRKRQRFTVKGGAYAQFYRPRFFKLGKPRVAQTAQIVDINIEGLAFEYTAENMWSMEFNELSISDASNKIKLEKIPYKPISDFIKSRHPSANCIRRCGVKFEKLTPRQKSQLADFIRNFTDR